jgi:hypothetical protein
MRLLTAVVCSLGFFIPVTGHTATELVVRLTGKWLKMNQEYVAKDKAGEFSETKRDARIRYELRAEGLLSAFDQNKEYVDNKVMGVEQSGSSSAQLVENKDKYYWRVVREWRDKAGKDKKYEKDFEVEFTDGNWDDYQDGKDIEATFTKASQKAWDAACTEVVTRYADDLRGQYATQYPSATIDPVVTEALGSKAGVKLQGNNEKMTVTGSDTYLTAKVKVNY